MFRCSRRFACGPERGCQNDSIDSSSLESGPEAFHGGVVIAVARRLMEATKPRSARREIIPLAYGPAIGMEDMLPEGSDGAAPWQALKQSRVIRSLM